MLHSNSLYVLWIRSPSVFPLFTQESHQNFIQRFFTLVLQALKHVLAQVNYRNAGLA